MSTQLNEGRVTRVQAPEAEQEPARAPRPAELSRRRCGAIARADGSVLWRVWAPRAKGARLVLIDNDGDGRPDRRREIPLRPEGQEGGEGYFRHVEPNVADGQRYALRLDAGQGFGDERPDPCSLWQPGGVAGPSAVVRPDRFAWTDAAWKGVPREELVFYELHVGTFTPEGTFEAIIPRLRELRELGVTALEVMPVGQFPGTRNWGYDGVLPYAAQHSYGGPLGLAKLVDAAHAAGLAVVLDVVYNHLGPEGNYLHEFGPYFTDRYKTPWGSAVNYDDRGCDPVRDFVLDNVRLWLEEFHLDGLRLDAVHAMYDLGARPILAAVKGVADEVAGQAGRHVHVIAESDLNDPRLLQPPPRGGFGLDAQWSDDFHHAAHALLTGERRGYYADYGSPEQLARAYRSPFLFAWEYSRSRGRKHGAPPEGLGGDRFVVCLQNHDQVGNRAKGDRLTTLLASAAQRRLAASLLLFAPHLPLLFMGEEYAESNPFPFFCSFCGKELVEAVRAGRKREFADFVQSAGEVPDPGAAPTFASAVLSWSWPEGSERAGTRRLYGDLLAARRQWPALRDYARRHARLLPPRGGEQGDGHGHRSGDGAGDNGAGGNGDGDGTGGVVLQLTRGGTSPADAGAVVALFNLGDRRQPLPDGAAGGKAPLFSSASPRYGGTRRDLAAVTELLPFECVAFGPADCQPLG